MSKRIGDIEVCAAARQYTCNGSAMIAMIGRFAGLWALLHLGCLFAADLVFSAGMEELTQETLTVKLADGRRITARLPKSGDLAASPIASRYQVADQVEMTCKRSGAFVKNGEYVAWDLKQLHFLRAATPAERSDTTTFRPWREAKNLLKGSAVAAPQRHPPANSPTTGLERARQVSLEYVYKLPNFVADEIATRSRLTSDSSKWQAVDVVESEISFQGNYATRQYIRVSGKAWNRPSLPLFTWDTGLDDLKPLFDPECPTTIAFAGREEVGGKPLVAYRFQSPRDGCFSFLTDGLYSYNPVRTGRFLVDDASGRVIRFEVECSGIPPAFRVLEQKEALIWDNVKIGDTSHWLPVAFDFVFRWATGTVWHADVEYRNHRHFEAATRVTFH
jgi:hypothetical protein